MALNDAFSAAWRDKINRGSYTRDQLRTFQNRLEEIDVGELGEQDQKSLRGLLESVVERGSTDPGIYEGLDEEFIKELLIEVGGSAPDTESVLEKVVGRSNIQERQPAYSLPGIPESDLYIPQEFEPTSTSYEVGGRVIPIGLSFTQIKRGERQLPTLCAVLSTPEPIDQKIESLKQQGILEPTASRPEEVYRIPGTPLGRNFYLKKPRGEAIITIYYVQRGEINGVTSEEMQAYQAGICRVLNSLLAD